MYFTDISGTSSNTLPRPCYTVGSDASHLVISSISSVFISSYSYPVLVPYPFHHVIIKLFKYFQLFHLFHPLIYISYSGIQRISSRNLRGRSTRHTSRGQVQRRRIHSFFGATRHIQRNSTGRRKGTSRRLNTIITFRLTRHIRTNTSRTYNNQRRSTTSRKK